MVVLTCVLVNSTFASWIQDMISSRGFDLGSGLRMHLDSNKDSAGNVHANWLDKHSLRVDYNGYGVRVGKEKGKEGLQVGLVVKNSTSSLFEGECQGQL